ncbi:MAG: hypothetical protein KTR13_07600 [Saprospiraceae bacterium]|nr:hypothetical protein [Saprospiraceae bacterium]
MILLQVNLAEGLQGYFDQFLTGISKVGVGLLMILVGWIVARIAGKIVTKLLEALKIDNLLEKLNVKQFLEKANMSQTVASIFGKFVFWFIMLIFIMAASDVAGLSIISEKISQLIDILPLILVAIVFLVVGMFVAQFVRDLIIGATQSMNLVIGKMAAMFVYVFLMIIVTITSLDIIPGFDTSLIKSNVVLFFAALLLAAVFSYSISSKDVLSNVLGGFFTKKIYPIGSEIEIDDIRGTIIDNNNIGIVLDIKGESVVIPNSEIVKKRVKILSVPRTRIGND